MQGKTIEQLRTASDAGGVAGVSSYGSWLAAELQKSIDDPSASIPHDEVMAELDAIISALK